MSKMEVQMVSTEMTGIKENMWKLSGRVQLMEKFIQKQFGDVFWDFVHEHADPNDYDNDLPRSPTPPIAPSVTVTLIQSSSSSSTNSSASNSESSSSMSTSSPSGPPPPPPLIPASSLAALTAGNGVSSSGNFLNSSSGVRHGARNFLPKSLSNNSKAKSVLRTSDSLIHHGAQKLTISTQNSEDRKPAIKQIVVGRGESILKSSLKALPVASSSNRVKPQNSLRIGSTPPTKPLALKRPAPAPLNYMKIDEGDDLPEPEGNGNKRMMNTIENLLAYSMPANRSVNIIRTTAGIKAETDGYSAAHNGFLREMRPNPCHTRCQNRCHDIWTHDDRMDVFQSYWSIPTEEERRQWVAERIERVDMATKKTEYSNFRTCTFKYYFPHPENHRVQVCKNFFLATIDEKRSYVEKIAQEVKGISEHYSVQDIPFRRKNQVKGSNGELIDIAGYEGNGKQYDGYEVVGWMTGGGMDGQGDQDQDQDYDDEYAEDGEEVDGMEMEEMVA